MWWLLTALLQQAQVMYGAELRSSSEAHLAEALELAALDVRGLMEHLKVVHALREEVLELRVRASDNASHVRDAEVEEPENSVAGAACGAAAAVVRNASFASSAIAIGGEAPMLSAVVAANGVGAAHQSPQRDEAAKSSRFKSVSWRKARKKWQVIIIRNGKQKNLGYFTDEVVAARAYAATLPCRTWAVNLRDLPDFYQI